MDEAHWILLGMTAAIAAALTVFSLSHEPKSRLYRWTRRVFWAAAALLFSGAVGGVGLNLFNLTAVTLLGLPGYVAAAAILSFP